MVRVHFADRASLGYPLEKSSNNKNYIYINRLFIREVFLRRIPES